MKNKIYLLTNLDSNQYRVYIGQTSNPQARLHNHKKKYGGNIQMTIIDEIITSNRKELKQLESFWIELFTGWGFKLDNKNKGGNGPNLFTEKSKLKLSNAKRGSKYPSFSTRRDKGILRENSTHNKKVNQYSLDGDFIQQWPSARKAQRFITGTDAGSVGDCCRGKCKTGYKFKWSYAS
jgi:hypothetical protein